MNETVLIIDDDENDIIITKRVLSKAGGGIRTDVARSGEAGLEFLRSATERPALVLLDLKMPGMNGFETIREIRADTRLKNIPVVVLTSSTLESDMTEAYASGADYFLHKAFDISQFTGDIRHLLERWLKT
ncbi:MAG: response regulator [Nitrospirae bacterium]|nr:response regulator [Nitrospirota bacterium]